jgi:hypothetical protein
MLAGHGTLTVVGVGVWVANKVIIQALETTS